MNDRIKQLAEKAGLSYMPSNYPDLADLYKGADFELEKFAELIVNECANFIDSHEQVDHFGEAKDIVYGDDVLKHFGFE